MKRILLLLILGTVIAVSGCTSQKVGEHVDSLKSFELSPSQLSQEIQEGGIKLLDVREGWEYQKSHLDGTLLLSVNNLTQENLDALGLQTSDKIVVYCRSGSRSEKAYFILQSLGYQNVRSLGGGIVHWEEDGYPVVAGSVVSPQNNGLQLDPKEYDFGQIPQFGGPVATEFTVTNTGNSTVALSQLTTSCGCTSAAADKTSILPGESATITVTFNPNLHEEPKERFRRTVFIDTSEGEIEATIWVDILEGV